MLIHIIGAKCIGIEAVPITVEVDVTRGLGVHLVGLADVAVKESLLRTMTALQSLGFKIPGKKIVINLAPADLHKKGSGFDVPIALGIIAASGQMTLPDMSQFLIMGELGLDAGIRPIQGVLPMAEMAQKLRMKACIFPEESAKEAAGCYDIPLYGVTTLADVLFILAKETGDDLPSVLEGQKFSGQFFPQKVLKGNFDKPLPSHPDTMDFSEIIGQEKAKRGLEIAAAGNHNVIMIGTPGSGKSSLAKALPGILPPLSREEAIIASKIYSVAGKRLGTDGLIHQRPFRTPHYSASLSALIGGGAGDNIMPGEISLAQSGVLFLDEFTQIPRNVAEALRAPLEDRKVTISRLHSKIDYPASFMLVAAANPCPCGYYGEGDRCSCSVGQRTNYLSRLSGPIMDRIDIQLWLNAVHADLLVQNKDAFHNETSAEIAQRVIRARKIQEIRFQGESIFTNAEMNNRQLNQYCPLSDECRQRMEKLIENMGLSARAFTRIIKLARTIADLEAARDEKTWMSNRDTGPTSTQLIDIELVPDIQVRHLVEAASYRLLDKNNI